jgi:pimeloyl-ACP methyl ester carboxylesterase
MMFPPTATSALSVQEQSPPPTLIFLHGIGNQDPTWINEAFDALPQPLLPRCVPFFWADLFDESPAGKVAGRLIKTINTFTPVFAPLVFPNQGVNLQSVLNAGIQYIAVPFLNRWIDKCTDVLSYNSVRHNGFKRLETLILQQPNEVILIAHSMGSVLAFEFLQQPTPATEKVLRLITLGSPLDRQPIKRQVLLRTGGKTTVACPWLNLWGSLDLVCCWQPWKSGELNSFYPNEQIKVAWQGHHLASYIGHIPAHYLM